jgi:hypothetical protein
MATTPAPTPGVWSGSFQGAGPMKPALASFLGNEMVANWPATATSPERQASAQAFLASKGVQPGVFTPGATSAAPATVPNTAFPTNPTAQASSVPAQSGGLPTAFQGSGMNAGLDAAVRQAIAQREAME